MERTDKITPVILVRNDAYWLPYCLKAVQGIFSRYVIYDIGSEDGTKDIIHQFGLERDDPWINLRVGRR